MDPTYVSSRYWKINPTYIVSGYWEKFISGTPNTLFWTCFVGIFYGEEIIFRFSKTTQLNSISVFFNKEDHNAKFPSWLYAVFISTFLNYVISISILGIFVFVIFLTLRYLCFSLISMCTWLCSINGIYDTVREKNTNVK